MEHTRFDLALMVGVCSEEGHHVAQGQGDDVTNNQPIATEHAPSSHGVTDAPFSSAVPHELTPFSADPQECPYWGVN